MILKVEIKILLKMIFEYEENSANHGYYFSWSFYLYKMKITFKEYYHL